MHRFWPITALLGIVWGCAPTLVPAQDVSSAVATVTVTNLTKGQILTPAVFITHNSKAPPLFVPGEPASPELSSLAELGITSGLINKFRAESEVLDVTRLSAFVHPGKTSTVDVKFDAGHRLISSASMLEMTNDGFVSLLDAEVPCEGVKTFFVGGWDAGSEANTELCSQVPAPCPSPTRSGVCSAATMEGFVHVHGGVHGCGGFPSERYDWGYPVARMTIEVSPDNSPAGTLEAACPGFGYGDSENSTGEDDGTAAGNGS